MRGGLQLAAIEIVNNAGDVAARLAIRRNAVILIDRGRPGVVRRQRECQVVVVALEQRVQIRGATVDVLLCAKAVRHP
jgi:hypothetical protein